MKRLILPFIAIYLSLPLKAQFPYGTSWAAYTPGYSLTSGIATSYTPGNLYFGYQPALQLGNWPWWPNNMNFFCKGFGPSGMWTEYKVYTNNGNSCNGPLTQVLNGAGISAIEANGSNNVRFAVAGAFDKGCYFAGLAANGSTVATKLYPFPNPPSPQLPAPTKPIIIQDRNTDDFFITGGCEGVVYIIRVDNAGNQIWSSLYKVMGDASPRDIIVNPYNTSEIIVVGNALASPSNQDAFILQVNSANGNLVNMKTYGGPQTQETFNSITQASAITAANTDGFVLGGTFSTPLATAPWIVKLDQNFSFLWNHRLQLSSGSNQGCVDIIERTNTFNGIEYYGLVGSSAGMVVVKLDDGGFPYPLSSGLSGNEFIYNLSGIAAAVPACLTQVATTTSSTDAGIQIYGTASNWTNLKSSLVIKAYYNGETTCNGAYASQNAVLPGPAMVTTPGCTQFGQLSSCSNFGIVSWSPGGTLNFPCSGYVLSGNNQRMIQTGIEETAAEFSGLKVFPNPTTEKITIDYFAEKGQYVDIRLTDMLGKEVEVLHSDLHIDTGAASVSFDLRKQGLQNGMYILSLRINDQVTSHKVMLQY